MVMIPPGFQMLQSSMDSLIASEERKRSRELQAEAEARARKTNLIQTGTTIAGAVAGGVSTGGSPQGIMLGAQAGRLAGGLVSPNPISGADAVQGAIGVGVGIDELGKSAASAKAYDALRADRMATLQGQDDAYTNAGATEGTVRSPAQLRRDQAVMQLSQMTGTDMSRLDPRLASAVLTAGPKPQLGTRTVQVGDTTALIQQDPESGEMKQVTYGKTGGGAEGTPRQAWVNTADADAEPVWKPQTITGNRNLEQLVDRYGNENVLLENPNRQVGQGAIFEENMIAEGRAAQWAANRGAKNIPTSEIEKEAFKRVMVQDLLEQRKQRTSTAFNPETQRVETVPGTKFQNIEEATTSTDLPKQAQAFLPAQRPVTAEGRPIVQNADGSISTERTVTFDDPRTPGAYVNIPTMFGGKQVSPKEAMDRIVQNDYRDPETGKPIQSYGSLETAERAAQDRSAALGKRYATTPGGGVTPLREGGTAKEKLTPEEYKGFTGSAIAMELLNVMSENVETTGPIVGPLKEFAQRNSLMTPDGTLDFALAKARLDNIAQEIIKGIPSNFDVQTFQKTLAKVGEDPEANKRAIQQGARQLARAMAEQIDYAKRFNKELPDQSLETARQFGVDVDGILSGKSKQQITFNKPLGIKLDPYTPDSAKSALELAKDKKNKGRWVMWKGQLRMIQ